MMFFYESKQLLCIELVLICTKCDEELDATENRTNKYIHVEPHVCKEGHK